MIWLILVLVLLTPTVAGAATRHATSSALGATGTTCSEASRCTVATALSQSVSGDTVVLQGNTAQAPYVYQGAADMIVAPATIDGVTVRCSVAGGCLLDGQFTRTPVYIAIGNDSWILEDFNVKNCGPNPSAFCVRITGNSTIVRRVVAWDTLFVDNNGNSGAIFSCQSAGTNNLFEDVAGFGIAAAIFSASQNISGDGHSCTFRRAWGRLEGGGDHDNWSSATGGAIFYNARRSTCENCLEEFRPNTGLTSFPVINPNATTNGTCPGAVCTDGGVPPIYGYRNSRYDGGATAVHDNQMLGSLFYTRQGSTIERLLLPSAGSATCGKASGCALFWSGSTNVTINSVLYKDVLHFFDPEHANFDRSRGIFTAPHNTALPLTLDHVSTVAGNANAIDDQWVQTSVVHASSLGTLNTQNANPWTGTAGANLCFRYVDRVKTATPLWPWPMNDRIKDATNIAGAYSGPCPGCVGTFPTRTETDVMENIQSILGTIPASCRSDVVEPFPSAPGWPAEAELSTFTDMAGFTTISGSGFTASGGAASPTSGFSIAQWDQQHEADQEVWGIVGSVPSTGEPLFLYLRQVDLTTRVRVDATPVAGVINDTLTLSTKDAGVTTTHLSAVDLGVDLSAGDRFGATCTGTTCTAYFCDTGWGECRTIGSGTTTVQPAASFLAIGAVSGSFSSFGGGGTATGGADITPPTAPGTFTVISQSESLTRATWTASTDAVGVTGYQVYRGTESDCSDCTLLATVGPAVLEYEDQTMARGATACYGAKGIDLAANASAFSTIDCVRVPDGAATTASAGRVR